MAELKHCILESIQECTGWCEKESSGFAVLKERKGVVPIHRMIVARSGRHYLPSFSTAGAALEKILMKDMET